MKPSLPIKVYVLTEKCMFIHPFNKNKLKTIWKPCLHSLTGLNCVPSLLCTRTKFQYAIVESNYCA